MRGVRVTLSRRALPPHRQNNRYARLVRRPAAALAITEGTEVTVLERLLYADGLRIGHLRNHLPRSSTAPTASRPRGAASGSTSSPLPKALNIWGTPS
jgi:DNA-binding GntR family transcriptional regulator